MSAVVKGERVCVFRLGVGIDGDDDPSTQVISEAITSQGKRKKSSLMERWTQKQCCHARSPLSRQSKDANPHLGTIYLFIPVESQLLPVRETRKRRSKEEKRKEGTSYISSRREKKA